VTSSAPHAPGGSGSEGGQRPRADSVVVVSAPSGEIVFSNRHAERVVGRSLSEIAADFPMFHLDGRPYAFTERQVPRSLTSGEVIVDEEFFGPVANGGRVRYRCSCWPVYDDGGQIVAAVVVTRDVTEQKRREERLGYLAGLLENSEDAVVAMDERYFLTVWNQGAERLYGWRAEEVVGRHANEVAQTNLSEEERSELRRELAENGRWRGEVAVARKDGTTVDVELISVALRGEQREITGYLTIHRDISERKRAEEALRAARRRSETILESITDAFVAVDREWRYTYVNERALRRMQWRSGRDLTREDVLGQGMWDLFPDAAGTTIAHKYREAMRERREVCFETYFAPSGEWIEAHAYPSEAGLSIYYRDVSDRKRAEDERESRARQQGVVAELGLRALATDELQVLMDEAVGLVARTLDVELASVAEMPVGSEEVIFRAGVGWREGVGSQIDSGLASEIGDTLLHGEPLITDDQAADPRCRPSALAQAHGVVSALSVMIASPDEPFGVLGALSTRRRTFSESDVSFVQSVANVLAGAVDRSRAQDRLGEVREAERRRLARDLHDDALQELTEAVIQAERGRTAGLDPAGAAQLASTLKGASQRLRGAIYDLRLEEEEGTPFAHLLEAVVALQGAMADDCEVELDIRDGVPSAALGGRGTEILRLVGEALTNARRHSQATSIRVSAWGSTERLCFEISDDGRGFEHGAVPSEPAGAGVTGMRERAALLDGDLDIRSQPGGGTKVRLEVELGDPEPEQRQVRVLLVEDHTAVRQAIAAMFEREPDFDVVGQAGSLAGARRLLREVDVAVVDLGLPDGYGGDLIKELSDVNPRAQALVLSASLDRAETARAVQYGAAGTLDKTARLAEVVNAVRRLRAGETLLPLEEVVELLRFADHQREQEHKDRYAIERLTPREHEVLQALADGLDSQAIADRLHISIRTERNHVASILAKLGVHSRLQALVFVMRYGVVDAP
jgi:PAS domain S-box-containing protein